METCNFYQRVSNECLVLTIKFNDHLLISITCFRSGPKRSLEYKWGPNIPKTFTMKASDSAESEWMNGRFIVKMKKRNMKIRKMKTKDYWRFHEKYLRKLEFTKRNIQITLLDLLTLTLSLRQLLGLGLVPPAPPVIANLGLCLNVEGCSLVDGECVNAGGGDTADLIPNRFRPGWGCLSQLRRRLCEASARCRWTARSTQADYAGLDARPPSPRRCRPRRTPA